MTQLVGCIGTVVIDIPGGEKPGEVRVIVGGTHSLFIARSHVEIPSGRSVLVTDSLGPLSIQVEPWGELWSDRFEDVHYEDRN